MGRGSIATMKTQTLFLPLAISAFLFTSCGKQFQQESRRFKASNPVFNPYIEKFEAHGRKYLGDPSFKVGNIPINFYDPDEATVQGICTQYGDGTKEIIIRQKWWEEGGGKNEKYRESLIFHELGHCRLARNHHDGTYQSEGDQNSNETHKLSLMNGILVVPGEFEQFEAAYLRELFQCSPTYTAKNPGQNNNCKPDELEAQFIQAAKEKK